MRCNIAGILCCALEGGRGGVGRMGSRLLQYSHCRFLLYNGKTITHKIVFFSFGVSMSFGVVPCASLQITTTFPVSLSDE